MQKQGKLGNYLKGLTKGTNFISNLIAVVVVAMLVIAFDKFDLFASVLGANKVNFIIVASALGVSAILFLIAVIVGLNKKNISFADNMLAVGFLAFIAAVAYSLVSVYVLGGGFLKLKLIASGTILLFDLTLLIIRCNNFVELDAEDAKKERANFFKYFGSIFKKFWLAIILFAVVAVGVLVAIDKFNVVSKFNNHDDLKLLLIVGLSVVALVLLQFFVERMKNKLINLVDIILLLMIIGGGVIFGLSFSHSESNVLTARIIAIALVAVALILMIVLCFNTHLETKDEIKVQKSYKPSLKVYLKFLSKKCVLLAIFAVAFALIAYVNAFIVANGFDKLLGGIKLENYKTFIIFALGVVAVAMIVLASLVARKISFVDHLVVALFIASLVCVPVFVVLKANTTSIIVAGSLAVFNLILVIIRICNVKDSYIEAQEEAEKAQATEEAQEEVQEEPATEEVVEEVKEEPVNEVVAEEIVATEEQPVKLKKVNPKKSFDIFLRTSDDQTKQNYTDIKNAIMVYGLNARMTKSGENFTKRGVSMSKKDAEKPIRLQVKMQIRGKYIKLYMNYDPTLVDAKYYRFKDITEKNPDRPIFMKVRSKLSVKRAIELINLLAEREGFKQKKNYQVTDYGAMFSDADLTYMQKLGYDYLVKKEVTLEEVNGYNDELADKLVKVETIAKSERYIYDEVTLDELCSMFKDGEVASMEEIRLRGLVKINANQITVKASEKLSKALTVEATSFDPKAVEMIFIAGGFAKKFVEVSEEENKD